MKCFEHVPTALGWRARRVRTQPVLSVKVLLTQVSSVTAFWMTEVSGAGKRNISSTLCQAPKWSQLDDSVKSALEKHPALTRYRVNLVHTVLNGPGLATAAGFPQL